MPLCCVDDDLSADGGGERATVNYEHNTKRPAKVSVAHCLRIRTRLCKCTTDRVSVCVYMDVRARGRSQTKTSSPERNCSKQYSFTRVCDVECDTCTPVSLKIKKLFQNKNPPVKTVRIRRNRV